MNQPQPYTVVFVDDDRASREHNGKLLRRGLEGHGIIFKETDSFAEAEEKLTEGNKPGFGIFDIVHGNSVNDHERGTEVGLRILEAGSDVNIAILSASPQLVEGNPALGEAGISGFGKYGDMHVPALGLYVASAAKARSEGSEVINFPEWSAREGISLPKTNSRATGFVDSALRLEIKPGDFHLGPKELIAQRGPLVEARLRTPQEVLAFRNTFKPRAEGKPPVRG